MKAKFYLAIAAFSIFCSSHLYAQTPVLQRQYAGVELNQLHFYIGNKNCPNLALRKGYRIHRNITAEAIAGFNSVRTMRGQSVDNIKTFECRGAFAKIGLEAHFVRRGNAKPYLGLGFRQAWVSIREKMRVEIREDYWGDYNQMYTGKSNHTASEYYFYFRYDFRSAWIRFEVSGLFEGSEKNLRYKDPAIKNMRRPFIPGYGYQGGGLNLVLGFDF